MGSPNSDFHRNLSGSCSAASKLMSRALKRARYTLTKDCRIDNAMLEFSRAAASFLPSYCSATLTQLPHKFALVSHCESTPFSKDKKYLPPVAMTQWETNEQFRPERRREAAVNQSSTRLSICFLRVMWENISRNVGGLNTQRPTEWEQGRLLMAVLGVEEAFLPWLAESVISLWSLPFTGQEEVNAENRPSWNANTSDRD